MSQLSTASATERVVLLVEDNDADADFLAETLAQGSWGRCSVVRATSLKQAQQLAEAGRFIMVLLDLGLPDSHGIDTLFGLRERPGVPPIIVLTGTNDLEFGHACIAAGAQDFLAKSEMDAHQLDRAMGFALARVQDGELRELRATLQRLRELSTHQPSTVLTPELRGLGPLRTADPSLFEDLVRRYMTLLSEYPGPGDRPEARQLLRSEMASVATLAGDRFASPRDLLDLHVMALERLGTNEAVLPNRSLVEARLFALEMMGLLVEYYRVGSRRLRAKERSHNEI